MKWIAGASVLALLAGLPVRASTIFLDQPSFLAAIPPGSLLETFDAAGAGLLSSNLAFPGFGAAAANGLFGVAADPAQPADVSLSTNVPTDSIAITFSQNVFAFGGFFFPTDILGSLIPGTITVAASDGTTVDVLSAGTLPSAFLGIVAGAPLTGLTVQALQTADVPTGVFPAVNDLYVATPEPGTAALIGLALLAGCGALRRRNA